MYDSGGCLLNDNLDWGTTFFSLLPLPGDPEIMGPGWRENWMARLEAVDCPVERWMAHPTRDAYWQHGSVNENYAAIECPVFAVGGWLDGYTNAIGRLLARLDVPRLGLIGPHAHQLGHSARAPGPATGFLQEALRWWDHWLKGAETGIMDEPLLRAFRGEDVPAAPWYAQCPGRWIAESAWPSPRIEPRRFHLNVDGLGHRAGRITTLMHRSPQSVGLDGGEWCPYGTGGTGPEFPGDQRVDDAQSLVFDSTPLDEPIEILGAPMVELDLAVDRPLANLAVRLNDVKPDGSVARVSYAILNLAHRNGHEQAQPLEPGETYRVSVQLNDAAYQFAPGHRIRVSLSNTYWPMIWPSPEPVTMTVTCGRGQLSLPVRSGIDEPGVPGFDAPQIGPPMPVTELSPPAALNTVTRDLATGRIEVCAKRGSGRFRVDEHQLEFGRNSVERLAITEGDPLSAETEVQVVCEVGRGEWSVEVNARTHLSSDHEAFYLRADLDVYENGTRVFCRSWDHAFARHHQ